LGVGSQLYFQGQLARRISWLFFVPGAFYFLSGAILVYPAIKQLNISNFISPILASNTMWLALIWALFAVSFVGLALSQRREAGRTIPHLQVHADLDQSLNDFLVNLNVSIDRYNEQSRHSHRADETRFWAAAAIAVLSFVLVMLI
jgi:hypothetical protein